MNNILAVVSVLLPILAGLVVALLSRIVENKEILSKAAAMVLATVFTLLIVIGLQIRNNPLIIQLFTLPLSSSTVKIGLYIDYLALLFAAIALFIATLTQIYSLKYYSEKNKAFTTRVYNKGTPLTLIFSGFLIAALFSMDLIGLLFSLEILTLATYIFISYPSERVKNLKAAFKAFILTHISGLTLLIFTLIMFTSTGSTQIIELSSLIPLNSPLIIIGASLMLCAAMPKTDQAPFHTWFPDSTVTTSPSIIIFHACGFQIGVYLLLRFLFQVFHEPLTNLPVISFTSVFGNITAWNLIVMVIGAVTLIIGAVYGMLENDYKKIIAYTTVSETGLIIIAVGLMTTLAFTACIYYAVSHALISTLLFFSYGSVEYATNETDINKIGGLYQYMPLTAVAAIISMIAIGGMPLLSEFVGKYLIINAALNIGASLFILLLFVGAALHIVIAIRILTSVFLTTTYTPRKVDIQDPPVEMLASMFIAVLSIFALGVLPNIFLDILVKPAVIQVGLAYTIIESFDLLITGSGFLTYITIASSALSIIGMVSYIILIGGRKKTKRKRSVDAEKPFIGGEDITVVKSTYTEQFYYYLVDFLRLRSVARLLDIDKFFDKIISRFKKLCEKLLKLDVGSYLKAVLMFLLGSLIITVIALIV